MEWHLGPKQVCHCKTRLAGSTWTDLPDVQPIVPVGTVGCTSGRSVQVEPASLVLQWHTCFGPRCHSMFPLRSAFLLQLSDQHRPSGTDEVFRLLVNSIA